MREAIAVPVFLAGVPKMMHSETPSMESSLLYSAASNYSDDYERFDCIGADLVEAYQMIRRLFERCQHQCRISGFLYTKSRDTEYFTLL
jgi:hypothetical protein